MNYLYQPCSNSITFPTTESKQEGKGLQTKQIKPREGIFLGFLGYSLFFFFAM